MADVWDRAWGRAAQVLAVLRRNGYAAIPRDWRDRSDPFRIWAKRVRRGEPRVLTALEALLAIRLQKRVNARQRARRNREQDDE
jgi:hypothetical protein